MLNLLKEQVLVQISSHALKRITMFPVSTYVESEDTREKIDIVKLNAEIEKIVMREDELREAWYPKTDDSGEVNYYLQFTEALCKMAIDRNRVTSTAKKSENEKYDFRCFLLRLGFIGDEYKGLRKFLMRNLSGNAAFKHGKLKEELISF